jgi:hypothetical protein
MASSSSATQPGGPIGPSATTVDEYLGASDLVALGL